MAIKRRPRIPGLAVAGVRFRPTDDAWQALGSVLKVPPSEEQRVGLEQLVQTEYLDWAIHAESAVDHADCDAYLSELEQALSTLITLPVACESDVPKDAIARAEIEVSARLQHHLSKLIPGIHEGREALEVIRQEFLRPALAATKTTQAELQGGGLMNDGVAWKRFVASLGDFCVRSGLRSGTSPMDTISDYNGTSTPSLAAYQRQGDFVALIMWIVEALDQRFRPSAHPRGQSPMAAAKMIERLKKA